MLDLRRIRNNPARKIDFKGGLGHLKRNCFEKEWPALGRIVQNFTESAVTVRQFGEVFKKLIKLKNISKFHLCTNTIREIASFSTPQAFTFSQ
jgi:hypothetical protein